eukprot:SAG22_NODE_516_length_9563_cov_29.476965_8_plen_68_part_00
MPAAVESGSMMTAASSLARLRISARLAASSLNGSTSTDSAVPGARPGETGKDSGAAPSPRWGPSGGM